jgi:hypothetical protein
MLLNGMKKLPLAPLSFPAHYDRRRDVVLIGLPADPHIDQAQWL